MLRSLYARLAAVLLGLLSLTGILYLAIALLATHMYLDEVNQRLNRDLAARLVVAEDLVGPDGLREAGLKRIFHNLMVVNPSIEVYLLDPDGAIRTYSAPPGKVKRQRVDLAPIHRFLDGAAPLPIRGDDPRKPGQQKVFSAAELIGRDGPLLGYLYVILAGEQHESAFQLLRQSYILRLGVGGGVLTLAVVLCSGLIFFRLLTRRLQRLTAAVSTFQEGDGPGPPVPDLGGDEIEHLGRAFDRMAARIHQQLERLREADTQRRRLVSNISHDLRTPLATLQVHLETVLLKETSLTPDERRRFLEVALRSAERLSRLVSELLELARLDSPEMAARPERFSLGELVQDVTQKFELAAAERGVSLRTLLPPNLPPVFADLGLLERVVENLLENALHHTPAGGHVSVMLGQEGRDVLAQVSDTGDGIAEADLPHLFDRFYRVDRGRSSREPGVGLGLAIARRILELHGGSIGVASRPGAGSTFTFRLPAADPAQGS